MSKWCYEGEVMKTLSLKLPESLLSKLNSTAKERGESRSTLIREAIETYITGASYVQKGSCLDLAGDLVGCVEGPVNLSFNKKHMLGYGQ